MTGGSPLVNRHHASAKNLPEASPPRFMDSQSCSASKPMRGNPRCNRMEIEELFKLMKDVICAEREVESAKIELALKSEYNITDAFN